MKPGTRYVTGLVLGLLGLRMTAGAAGDALPDGRWVLTLSNARPGVSATATADTEAGDEGQDEPKVRAAPVAAPKTEPDAGLLDFELVLERADGKWVPLFSDAERIFGLVENVDPAGDVRVRVLFDTMGRSGDLFKTHAVTALIGYTLTLRATAGGSVAGTWTSPVTGKGDVTGRILPMPTAPRPAPASGEHPRFLLRAGQIPTLKARAATPWGQSLVKHLDKEAWSRSGRAVGLGLLYRITGDKAYAKRAQELVLRDMDGGWWDVIGPIHDPPHKVMEAVYTWDLIHDACDADFQKRLLAKARGHMRFLDNFCDIDRGNGHPYSNWSAQYQTGVGMAALALLADPSDFREPAPDADIPTLTPPKEPVPQGLPVLPFDGDGRQVVRWLAAGPFDIGLGHDGLAAIGGAANAKVYDGLTFPIMVKGTESKEVNDKDGFHLIQMKNSKFLWSTIGGDDGQPLTRKSEGVFRPVPKAWICSPTTYKGAPGYLDLRIASGYRSYRTFYLAAALNVPAPVTVSIRFQNQQRDDPCVYIAGRKFGINDMVRLEAGTYPVLQPVTYTSFIGSHGRDEAIYHGFHLVPVTAEQKAKMLARRQALNEFQALCAKTLAGTPYADYWPRLWLASARAKMDAFASNAISERGWNIAGDCYTLPSLQALGPFAHAYATAMGRTLASPGNLGWVLPHQVSKTIFSDDRAFAAAYGRGGGPYGPMPYARCFPFVDPTFQPAVGWAAQKTLDLALAGKLASENLVVDDFDPMSAAFALLDWPAPEDVKSPQGIVPLAIADHQRCAWTFRNRFKDGDDAVASIAGFIHPGGDWGDVVSGEFRLAALGCEWALRGAGKREFANVVLLADEGGAAKPLRGLVYREPARRSPDGASVVRLDLRPLLMKDKQSDSYGPPLGSRTFLADGSGACGAPVLVVVRDELPVVASPAAAKPEADLLDDAVPAKPKDLLPGDSRKPKTPPAGSGNPVLDASPFHRWQLVTDPSHTVALRPDGFSLAATNGATLNATVLRPAAVVLSQMSVAVPMELNYRYDHRGGKLPRTVIVAAGSGPFLVAMTVQRGPAPKVSLSGDRIVVGGRRVNVTADALEIAP